jgi:hypothetical protein
MSPSNFARLAEAEPRLRGTYWELARWAEAHRDWKWVDAIVLARDLPNVDVVSLAEALDSAVRHGVLRVKYTVLTPGGALASQAFDSPKEIPARLPDRFEDYFETAEYPIVSVFESLDRAAIR